jgi:hypothetical protein
MANLRDLCVWWLYENRMRGIFFHWSDVFTYAVILAIQLVGIAVIVMLTRKYARWKEAQL